MSDENGQNSGTDQTAPEASQGDGGTNTPSTAAATTPAPEEKSGGKKGPPLSRVFNADGTIYQIGDTADSVVGYVQGFHKVAPVVGSGGYTSFVTTDDAFTNQKMLTRFSAQGVAKQMALLTERAAQIILDGGDEGAAMTAALKGIKAFESVAIQTAQEQREQAAFNEAILTLAKAKGVTPEVAAQQLAAFVSGNAAPAASQVPPASVEPSQPTVGEAGSTIADSGDSADEGDEGDSTESAPAPSGKPMNKRDRRKAKQAERAAAAGN